jgi:hypothetical protein
MGKIRIYGQSFLIRVNGPFVLSQEITAYAHVVIGLDVIGIHTHNGTEFLDGESVFSVLLKIASPSEDGLHAFLVRA